MAELQDEKCPICMQDLDHEEEPFDILPCTHKMHSQCLESYAAAKSTHWTHLPCALCRIIPSAAAILPQVRDSASVPRIDGRSTRQREQVPANDTAMYPGRLSRQVTLQLNIAGSSDDDIQVADAAVAIALPDAVETFTELVQDAASDFEDNHDDFSDNQDDFDDLMELAEEQADIDAENRENAAIGMTDAELMEMHIDMAERRAATGKGKGKGRAKSKAKAQAKPHAKAQAKPHAKAQAKPHAKAKAKPQAKPKANAKGRSKGNANGRSIAELLVQTCR